MPWTGGLEHPVDEVGSRLSKHIYLLRTLSYVVDRTGLKWVYFAQVHSIISYGTKVWRNDGGTERLSNILKRAMRIIVVLRPWPPAEISSENRGWWQFMQCTCSSAWCLWKQTRNNIDYEEMFLNILLGLEINLIYLSRDCQKLRACLVPRQESIIITCLKIYGSYPWMSLRIKSETFY